MLQGMTQGLGSPNGKAIPPEVLAEAAAELATEGGDVTAARFKGFVRRVMGRASEGKPDGKKQYPTNDRASRTYKALSGWLAEKESQTVEAEIGDNGIE